MVIEINFDDLLQKIEQIINNSLSTINVEKKTENYVSVKKAAEILEVHQNTIREWVRRGKLESKKIGSKVFINSNFTK